MKTEQLLKIYKAVRVKVEKKSKFKYPPRRKHYNIHTYG